MQSGGLLLLSLTMSAARAEGSSQLGGAAVADTTVVYVDILDHTTESITYNSGIGSLTVRDPSGAIVATLAAGSKYDTYDPATNGPHELTFSALQTTWDVTVNGAAAGYERVWSYR